MIVIAGCSPEKYKQDADDEVYKILDQKWQESFGPKPDLTIADKAPSVEDEGIKELLPETGGRLSLKDAVMLATRTNRDYQRQKESLYMSVLDLTLERHQFSPIFFGKLDGGYDYSAKPYENTIDDPELVTVTDPVSGDPVVKEIKVYDPVTQDWVTRTRQVKGLDHEEKVSFGTNFGFNLLLAEGTQISMNIATEWARYLTGDPRSSAGSVLSATIKQPLLRGRNRKVILEGLTQAERNVLYDLRSFNRYRKTFVVNIIERYYRVLQSLDEVKNAKNNYDNLMFSQEQAIMMAETGRRPRYEADQAKQRTFQARDSYIRAQQRYEADLDSFKINTLSLPAEYALELDPNELLALEEIGILKNEISLDDSVETAIQTRLDLLNTTDQYDDAQRKIIVAKDNLGADLDLVLGANSINSRGDDNIGTMEFHKGPYNIGLNADLGLDRKSERNAYRRALISLVQSERELAAKTDDVKLEVRQAYRDLQESLARYEIQQQSLKLAEMQVESTSMLLQEGRTTTRDLLEARDSLLSAQNSTTGALIDHTIAKLSFFRDIGLLQVQEEGLWNQPSESDIEAAVVSDSNAGDDAVSES